MGNSESALSPYRYNFQDPRVGDFDLSGIKVFKIDDRESAEAAKEFLRHEKVLYVDCEGRYFGSSEQKLGTVQVATGLDCCLVFHITKYRQSLVFLKTLFESDKVQKVFHDCSGDSAVLFHELGIRLNYTSVDDTQIAHKIIQSRRNNESIDQKSGLSLSDLYWHYCERNIPGNKHFNKSCRYSPGGNIWIDNPELFDGMVKYAVVDALAVCEIFDKQERLFIKNAEYRSLVQKQLEIKIKKPNLAQERRRFEMQNPDSFNWGLLAAGAAVAIVLGAAAASSLNTDKKQTKSNSGKTDEEKKGECIIS